MAGPDQTESALEQAQSVVGEPSVAIAGGAYTISQYLTSGLIEELRLHSAPMVLGAGERLFEATAWLDLVPISSRASSLATHVTYRIH
ncbi:MAG: dihydrofolate reductase family protein [Homoserinimonas sp.]